MLLRFLLALILSAARINSLRPSAVDCLRVQTMKPFAPVNANDEILKQHRRN